MAPSAGVTCRTRAAHWAYQPCVVVTWSSTDSRTDEAGPTRGNAGAVRPIGKAGMPSERGRPRQMKCRLPSSSMSLRSHGCSIAPRSRMRSRTPRTQASASSSVTSTGSSDSPPASSTACRAAAVISPGAASTSAATVLVISSVRPSWDCRPNSRTASKASRLRDPLADALRDLRQLLGLPEGSELLLLGQVGRQDAVAQDRVVPGTLDDPLGEHVERGGGVAHCLPQHRADGQAVRPALHEAGPVRGVLHAVGEDQGLLLGGVEVGAAEERGERDGELGRDGRAEEPDPVALLAGGAVVLAGGVVGLHPDVGEHRQHRAVLGRLPLGSGREQLPLGDVEPAQAVRSRRGFLCGPGARRLVEHLLALGARQQQRRGTGPRRWRGRGGCRRR